jgi:hypothetical protein
MAQNTLTSPFYPTTANDLMAGSINTSNILFQPVMVPNPPHHSILGGALNPVMPSWPVDADYGKKKLKLSKFEEAKKKLRRPSKPLQGIDWYFEHVSCEDVIQTLGWWNPTHGGRPKMFVQKLLDGIPSACPGKGMHWKGLGLMYFTPPVVGRSRSKNRTSVAGLALLKHWAENFPGFKRFFDAYYDPKCETEITLDCIDLALGVFPTRFQKVTDANKGKIEAKQQKEMENYKSAMAHVAKQQAAQQYANQYYQQANQGMGVGSQLLSSAQLSNSIMDNRKAMGVQMQASKHALAAQMQANITKSNSRLKTLLTEKLWGAK